MLPTFAARAWILSWFCWTAASGCGSVGLPDERPRSGDEGAGDGAGHESGTTAAGSRENESTPDGTPVGNNAADEPNDLETTPTADDLGQAEPDATADDDEAGSSAGSDGRVTSGSQQFSRLTRAEYAATIEASLGVTPDVNSIPEDSRVGPFTSNAESATDPVHPYMLAARELAATVIPSILPACDAADAEACLGEEYAEALGVLYRRPVTDGEIAVWAATMNELAAEGVNSTDASRALLGSMLMGPDFLYRSTPQAGSNQRLTELLAFALWDAPPDEELTQLALATDLAPRLPNLIEQVLSSERAVPVLARFLAQWLDVDTDLRLEDPSFADSPEYQEVLGFVSSALDDETPITQYVAGDQSLLLRELFLASTRHPDRSRRPIFRGLVVRRALLCDEIPAPSADLVALSAEVGDRTEDARCAGCHQLLDPIGGAFAVFDDDEEAGDGGAEVLGHAELEGTYDSLSELLTAVSQSRAFAECFAEHWLEFLLETSTPEPAWVESLADAVQGGASLRDLVVQSAHSLADQSQVEPPWCGAP